MNAIEPRLGFFNSPTSTVDQDPNSRMLAYRDPRVDMILKMFSAAKKAREPYDKDWNYYLRLFRGIQWEDKIPIQGTDWRSYLVINYLMANIMTIEAILMDSSPRISVSATSPYQQPYAMVLQHGLDSLWDRNKLTRTLMHASLNTRIFGVGYMKQVWDWNLCDGEGDATSYSLPSDTIYPSPGATAPENAAYIIEKKRVTRTWVRKWWPDFQPMMTTAGASDDNKQESGDYRQGFDSKIPFRYNSPVSGDIRVGDQTAFQSPPYRTMPTESEWYDHFEVWMDDDTPELQQIPVMMGVDPMGQPITEMREYEVPMYPHGRLVHMVGGVIVHDDAAPYPFKPYAKMVDTPIPDEWFGMGCVELAEDLQLELNKRRSQMTDHANLMMNMVWLVDLNSGVKPTMLNNKPGSIIWKTSGSEVRRLEPPNMPSAMPAMAQMSASDMQNVLGVGSAPTGAPPKGARSGNAMEAAQNIQTMRIRYRGHELEMGTESQGRQIVTLLQLFYVTPRWVQIMGDANQVYWVPFDGKTIRGTWDIRCESSATAPISKAARAQQAPDWFQKKLIDQRAALEMMEVPGYEETLKRMGVWGGPTPTHYGGWPGNPENKSPSDHTGYATSVRMAPPPSMAPGPAQPQPQGKGGAPGGAPQMPGFGPGSGKGGGKRK